MEESRGRRKREDPSHTCSPLEHGSQLSRDFNEILGSRKQARLDIIKNASLQTVKDEALEIIEQNQNFQGMLMESLTESSKSGKTSEGLNMTIAGCLEAIKSQAMKGPCPADLLASELLSEKLIEPFTDRKPISLISAFQKETTETLIKIMKSLIAEHLFNRVHFARCLSNHDQVVTVEILWMLHASHVLSFTTYLACAAQNPGLCNWLGRGLTNLSSCSEENVFSRCKTILTDLLGSLLCLAYPEKSCEPNSTKNILENVSKRILQTVVEGTIDCPCDSKERETYKRLEILEVVRGILDIPQTIITKFYTEELENCFHRRQRGSDSVALVISELVGSQHKWRFSALPENMRTHFQQFLYVFEPPVILEFLKRAFSDPKANWHNLLSFVSVFAVCVPEASKLLEEYTNTAMADSLASCDQHALGAALLVIRQLSLEGSHVSKPYVTWFQAFFADPSTSGLNNKRSVQFFFRFLSDLVPFEPAQNLKVHIIKSPQVPQKVRQYLTDYMDLAKTRLMDLKEPIELSGTTQNDNSYSDPKSENSKQLQQAGKEVEHAIEQFEKTAKVPPAVMEASIFRKPYFVGRFLPALLLPRKAPDSLDSREQLIMALSKANKIPVGMLSAYQIACQKISEDHFEASSSEDDSQLTDVEKLAKCLENLTKAVLQQSSDENVGQRKTGGVSGQLSLLAGHISTILKTNATCVLPEPLVILDAQAPSLDTKAVQVVGAVLNGFCRVCAAVRRVTCGKQGSTKFQWSSDFVLMLAGLPVLHMSLCYRLWDLLCSEDGPCLSDHHVYGLAVLYCYLYRHRNLFTLVVLRTNLVCDHERKIIENFLRYMPCSSSRSVDLTVRFSCAVIHHCTEAFSAVSVETGSAQNKDTFFLPVELIQKLWYVDFRLCANQISSNAACEEVSDSTSTLLRTMVSSDLYKKLLPSVPKVTFEEWLKWEMIQRRYYFLSNIDRRQYLQLAVLSHFLPSAVRDGGCGCDARLACATIMDVLLDTTSGEKSSTYDRCTRTCQEGSRTGECQESREDIIYLLKEMTSLLSRQQISRDETRSSWLLSQYYRRIDHVTQGACVDGVSETVLIAKETTSFTEIWLQLPPYLLFSDDSSILPSTRCVTAVTKFINTALRPHVANLCSLPLNLMIHVLKGIMSFGTTEELCSASLRHLHRLIQDSPIFHVALQNYWPQAKAMISSVFDLTKERPVITDMEFLHKWIGRILSEEEIPEDAQPRQPAPVIGAAIYHTFFSSTRPCAVVERLVKCASPQVAVCVLDCLVARCIELVQSGKKIDENTAVVATSKEIVCRLPDALLVFETEKTHQFIDDLTILRTMIVCGYRAELLPVVFFCIILSLEESNLQKLTANQGFKRIVLRMRDRLSELRKTCLDDKSLMNCGKPFHVDFTSRISALISHLATGDQDTF